MGEKRVWKGRENVQEMKTMRIDWKDLYFLDWMAQIQNATNPIHLNYSQNP